MDFLITVIVPISKMSGKLRQLEEWLCAIDMNAYQVILVHDVQDSETGPELEDLLKRIINTKPKLVSGQFGSPGMARNEGFQYVKGKWVAFWDSDDEPNHVEFKKMVEVADSKNCKIAIGGFSKTDNRTGFKESMSFPRFDCNGSNIASEPGIWRWAFLANEIMTRRFTDLRMGEDQVFLSQMDFSEREVYLHKHSVYSYSLNRSGQLTSDRTALSDLIAAMRIELEDNRKSKLPMNTFLISILLKQSITAIKSRNIDLICQAFSTSYSILQDAVKNRNTNIFKSTKSLLNFVAGKKNQEKLQTIFALGGFGNQLFQVAAGLSISKGSNFYLDYSHGPQHKDHIDLVREYHLPDRILVSKKFKLGVFRRKIFNLCIRFSSLGSTNGRVKTFKNLGRNLLERFLLFVKIADWRINSGIGFDPEVADCGKNYLLGYFQTFQDFYDRHTHDLLRSLRLKNPSVLFNSHQREIKAMNSLIVHIRLRDYLQEPKFGQISPQYFQTVIQKVWDTGRFNRICLFSDDALLAIKYVPSGLEDRVWSPNSGLTSTAETFELMRHGTGYVLSNSSFSWWAASLSYEATPVIVAPKPWFQPRIEPIDLIPQDWISVSKLDFGNVQIALY